MIDQFRAFTHAHELPDGRLEITGTFDQDDEFTTDTLENMDFLKHVELVYTRADGVKFYGMYTHTELCRMCFLFCSKDIISLTMAKMPKIREIHKSMLEITFSAHSPYMPEFLVPKISLRAIRESSIKDLNALSSQVPLSPIESKRAYTTPRENITIQPPCTVDLYSLSERLARIEENISILARVALLHLSNRDQPRLETTIISGLLEIVKSSKDQMQQLCAQDKIYILLEDPEFLKAAVDIGLKACDFEPQDNTDCLLSRLINSHRMPDDHELSETSTFRNQCDKREHIQALINIGVDVNHTHRHVSCDNFPLWCRVCGEPMDYENLIMYAEPFKVILRKIKEASFDDYAMLDSLFEIKQMLKRPVLIGLSQ